MAEQIHESMIHTRTSLPFPIKIYKLCNRAWIRVSLHLDLYVEALWTMDPSLIKANENSVALQRATSPPILDLFSLEPQTQEPTPTTTSSTPVALELPQVVDTEVMLSSDILAPVPPVTQVYSVDFSLMSACAFQALVCRLVKMELQLSELMSHLKPRFVKYSMTWRRVLRHTPVRL